MAILGRIFVLFFLMYTVPALGNLSINASLIPRNISLSHYPEILHAKSLIDTLQTRLQTDITKYEEKYISLEKMASIYRTERLVKAKELKALNTVALLLGRLSLNSHCGTNTLKLKFKVIRPIVIRTTSSVIPEGFTVKLLVNHRDLIKTGLALKNGNDLRIYFKKTYGQFHELDRVMENIGTTKAVILFRLQKLINKNTSENTTYYLVYGKPNANPAKSNPDNVYLFYDTFSGKGIAFGKKWQKIWGSAKVQKGQLIIKTVKTLTGDNADVAIYVKNGNNWRDIEVEMDLKELRSGEYPGPFLRLENPSVKQTSGWWFEYSSNAKSCTMRPFKNNKDGGWLYQGKLSKPLSTNTWIHAKYRVVGDRFSHWVNGKTVHNNVKVSSSWMLKQGTLGLGCHTGHAAGGCYTIYDNIKVTKYDPATPTLSLGFDCKEVGRLGLSRNNAAASCYDIHHVSLHHGQSSLQNGVYWIKTGSNGLAVKTYCDLKNGGWTLVGKINGKVGDVFDTWLIKNHNTKSLSSPILPSTNLISCIDARYLGTFNASKIRFSSGDNLKGIGSKWIEWSLPDNREYNSIWAHAVGRATVAKASMNPVVITAWNGEKKICYQNKYGIMPYRYHGGSYPAVSADKIGNTAKNDYCMAVGVQKKGTTKDGWNQNGNGFDTPQSNSDWPGGSVNHGSPSLTVWLK